jgi:hypothetical protein
MSRRTVIGLKVLGIIAAAAIASAQTALAQAQEPAPDIERGRMQVIRTPGADGAGTQDTFVFVSNAAPVAPFGGRVDIVGGMGMVPGMVVTGKPYSADAITESTQMLADGNRISQRNEMRIYRDGEGRTRREQTLGGLGVWQTANEPTTTITIHDPVAEMSYMLDSRTETAHAIRPFMLHAAHATASAIRVDGDDIAVVHEAVPSESVAPQVGTFELPVPPPAAGIRAFPPTAAISAVPFAAGEVTTEDLGEQILQGVRARGSRETRTIPAGTIGNERPIEMVTERWYSDEIEADVLRRHVDPRFGETEYRLVNVVLGEPSPDLFVVPESYEFQAVPNRFEFKLPPPGPGDAEAP